MHRHQVVPAPTGSKCFRVMSLNVAHGRKLAKQQLFVRKHKFQANLSEVAAVLRREAADVIALQEADGPSFWSGNFHHVERLAGLAGYEHHFWGQHNAMRFGKRQFACGTALLSREPLRDTISHVFGPSPPTARKGFVVATVACPWAEGCFIDVVSVHLDFLRKASRRRQILEMEHELAHRTNPRVILGDMNCWWWRRNDALKLLAERLNVQPCRPDDRELATFPSRRPMFRIDWILVSPELQFSSYRIVDDKVSDHLGVIAEIGPVPAA